MRRLLSIVLLALSVAMLPVAAITRVSVEQLNAGDWERLRGQQVEITTPLYVCGVYYDSLVLAPERLYVPEERAVGLSSGDSTELWRLRAYNRQQRICLQAKFNYYDLTTGSVVRGLRAYVNGERRLVSGQTPHFRQPKALYQLPRKTSDYDLTICSANIQNFFYHLGGYASNRYTRGQYELQRLKIAKALVTMNADLYTLCELEKGDAAPTALVEKMNELTRSNRYAYVCLGGWDCDTISVGFIYRKDRVEPYGEPRFAYQNPYDIYAFRFVVQEWQTTDTYERFIVSLNHLRSKRGDPAEANAKRMRNVDSLMACVEALRHDELYGEERVLVVGDFNSYTYEQPIQTLVEAGYKDMLPMGGYSYCYDAEIGYLDRVFASDSMAVSITEVTPIHWNADFSYSLGFKSKYNYKNRMIPTESPDDIMRCLSAQAKRNLLYRYADHDPILIYIKF